MSFKIMPVRPQSRIMQFAMNGLTEVIFQKHTEITFCVTYNNSSTDYTVCLQSTEVLRVIPASQRLDLYTDLRVLYVSLALNQL